MLPLLFGALMAGAAISAWNMFQDGKKGKGNGDGEGEGEGKSPDPGDEAGKDFKERKARNEKDDLLRKVVAATEFTTSQMVVGQRVLGTERHDVPWPADDIDVRKMQSLSQIRKVQSKDLMMPDEAFYPRAATNDFTIIEHVEVTEVTEDIMGESRKVLVVLHDVSGSMDDYGRIRWAIRLQELMLDRCIQQGAEYRLYPFEHHIRAEYIATTPDECREVKDKLSYYLRVDGGTRTHSALLSVLEKLKQEQFGEIRILLVSDGQDHIDVSTIRHELDEVGAYLHTVCISDYPNREMERASDRFDFLPFG